MHSILYPKMQLGDPKLVITIQMGMCIFKMSICNCTDYAEDNFLEWDKYILLHEAGGLVKHEAVMFKLHIFLGTIHFLVRNKGQRERESWRGWGYALNAKILAYTQGSREKTACTFPLRSSEWKPKCLWFGISNM